MPNRNGRAIVGWVGLGLMVAGFLTGVVLAYADNHHTAAEAHDRIDRLEPTIHETAKNVARILGILEGKPPSE